MFYVACLWNFQWHQEYAMKSLIFDTETTGFPLFKERSADPRQPGLLELAWILYDHELQESIDEFDSLVVCEKPIEPSAFAVHGLTTEMCADGAPLDFTCEQFMRAVREADRIVAHNLSFDKRIMRIQFASCEIDPKLFMDRQSFCTMLTATPIMKLKSEWGYKWPTLQEAYRHFIDRSGFEAHRAMADARACLEIMKKLESL
jgi:DNA polymerase III epsilon subunit-like protein